MAEPGVPVEAIELAREIEFLLRGPYETFTVYVFPEDRARLCTLAREVLRIAGESRKEGAQGPGGRWPTTG